MRTFVGQRKLRGAYLVLCSTLFIVATTAAASTTALEQAIRKFDLTPQILKKIASIAQERKAADQQVLPGFPFQTVLSRAVESVVNDGRLSNAIRKTGLTPKAYVVGVWSIALYCRSGERIINVPTNNYTETICRKHRLLVNTILD